MPSKRESSTRVDYVPALCTHRPSLLPIEWLSAANGRRAYSRVLKHYAVVDEADVLGRVRRLGTLDA